MYIWSAAYTRQDFQGVLKKNCKNVKRKQQKEKNRNYQGKHTHVVYLFYTHKIQLQYTNKNTIKKGYKDRGNTLELARVCVCIGNDNHIASHTYENI